MNIVRSADAERFENGATCVAYEYDTGSTDINIARVDIAGRYPAEGSAVNAKVRELVYVESGSGEVTMEGTAHTVMKGDVISIGKGESALWSGTMTLVIACAPAWTTEQYKIIFDN